MTTTYPSLYAWRRIMIGDVIITVIMSMWASHGGADRQQQQQQQQRAG
jgi:hypothetical protein